MVLRSQTASSRAAANIAACNPCRRTPEDLPAQVQGDALGLEHDMPAQVLRLLQCNVPACKLPQAYASDADVACMGTETVSRTDMGHQYDQFGG
jgi:hypothetical protein